MFQNYIGHFTGGLWYTYLIDVTPASYAAIREVCEKEGTGAFLVRYTADSIDQGECHIYATEKTEEDLFSGANIRNGVYKSLLSGKCEIVFHDFSELERPGETAGSKPIYFLDDESTVKLAQKEINRDEKIITALEKDNGNPTWILYVAWGVSFVFLLLLTWMCIQFDRKKDFIRISMGQSRLEIILTGMIKDTTVYVLTFLLSYYVLGRIIYLSFRLRDIILFFCLFIIVNNLLYFSLYGFRYKEVIYGANINLRLLSGCYVLKLIISACFIATISLCIMEVNHNGRYLEMYDDINEFRNHYVLEFEPGDNNGEDPRTARMKKVGQFFIDRYCDGSLALAASLSWTRDSDGKDHPLLILNRASLPLIHSENIKDMIKDKDYYLFVPRGKESNFPVDEIDNFIYYTFGVTEGSYTFESAYYDDPTEILFFDLNNLFYLEYGFEKEACPSFLYCNISGEKLKEIAPPYPPYPIEGMTLMYEISEDDVNRFREEYGFKSLERISVVNICNKHKALFLRNILLSGIMSCLLLFLSAVIILILSRLEYTVNARLLSIKKMLGYSVIKKNGSMLLLNMIAIMIGGVVNVMVSILTGLFWWYLPLACTGILFITEFLLMAAIMSWFERRDSIKLLKGGLL